MTATMEPTLAKHRDNAGPQLPQIRSDRGSWLVLAVAAVCAAYGISTVGDAAITEYGLLATASPALAGSIALTAAGFALAIRRRNHLAAICAIVLMILAQRLPGSIATDMPMYSWTYKHLGVVDYIQHEGALARGVDIYNGWPGLFTTTAWLSDVTGVSAVSLAHWFTVPFHLMFATLAYAVARAWGAGRSAGLATSFLVVAMNWVAQDYFSPQATGMLFTAAILVLVGRSREKASGTLVIVILFAALTITHQLTPYWLFGVIGLLALTRRMKPWWIIFPLGIILFSFLAYNFGEVDNFTLFSSNVADNAKSNIPTVGSVGQQFTSLVVRSLSGAFWALAAWQVLRRMRRKEQFWAPAVLAFSPMLILGGQGYGGEAIFRVFLYSLLGCSILIAVAWVPAIRKGRIRFGVFTAALMIGSVLSAQGFLGGWFANIMPKDQVEASETVLEQAQFPAYLTVAAPVWPQRSTWRYVKYARFSDKFDDPMIFAAKLVGSHFDTDEDYAAFTEAIDTRVDAPTYLIITEQMRLYAWYFGILPLDALPNLKARVSADPAWETVYDDFGLSVYFHKVTPQQWEE